MVFNFKYKNIYIFSAISIILSLTSVNLSIKDWDYNRNKSKMINEDSIIATMKIKENINYLLSTEYFTCNEIKNKKLTILRNKFINDTHKYLLKSNDLFLYFKVNFSVKHIDDDKIDDLHPIKPIITVDKPNTFKSINRFQFRYVETYTVSSVNLDIKDISHKYYTLNHSAIKLFYKKKRELFYRFIDIFYSIQLILFLVLTFILLFILLLCINYLFIVFKERKELGTYITKNFNASFTLESISGYHPLAQTANLTMQSLSIFENIRDVYDKLVSGRDLNSIKRDYIEHGNKRMTDIVLELKKNNISIYKTLNLYYSTFRDELWIKEVIETQKNLSFKEIYSCYKKWNNTLITINEKLKKDKETEAFIARFLNYKIKSDNSDNISEYHSEQRLILILFKTFQSGFEFGLKTSKIADTLDTIINRDKLRNSPGTNIENLIRNLIKHIDYFQGDSLIGLEFKPSEIGTENIIKLLHCSISIYNINPPDTIKSKKQYETLNTKIDFNYLTSNVDILFNMFSKTFKIENEFQLDSSTINLKIDFPIAKEKQLEIIRKRKKRKTAFKNIKKDDLDKFLPIFKKVRQYNL